MKKRMTDTEIWDKEWFMDLSPKHKCLIRYLFDKCDAAGVWQPNWKLATLHIGVEVNERDLEALPAHQFEVIEGGKIYLKGFINFQYVTLSETSPAHKPVFSAILKNNLYDRVFGRVSHTLQEKDKKKNNNNTLTNEEEEKEKIAFTNFQKWIEKNAPQVARMKEPFTQEQFKKTTQEYGKEQVREILIAMHNHKPLLSKNVSAYLTMVSWINRRKEQPLINGNHKPVQEDRPSGPPLRKLVNHD